MDEQERAAADRPRRRTGSLPTRRQFLAAAAGTTLLAGSSIIPGVPTTARAQTTPLPGPPWRIGYIDSTPGPADAGFPTARYYGYFRQGLRKLPAPYTPNNVHVEARFSNTKLETTELRSRLEDLLGMGVQALVIGVTRAIPVAADLTLTSKIPIVMAVSADPVAAKRVTQLPYSGTNITGLTMNSTELIPAQLQLLQGVAPDTVELVVLSAGDPAMNAEWNKILAVTPGLGMHPRLVIQPDKTQFIPSIQAMAPFDAIFVLSDVLMNHNARYLGQALTNVFAVPTLFGNSESIRAGGLVSLGADRPAMFEYAAQYVKQILDGAYPGSMAIQGPPRYEKGFSVQTAVSLIGKDKKINIPPWAVHPYAVVDA